MTPNDPDQAAPSDPAPGSDRPVTPPAGAIEATAAFTLGGPGGSSLATPAGPPPGQGGRFPFLGPPRFAGDLGWLAHYRIKGLIGTGSVGLVFRAEDVALARPVALKVIKPELAADPAVRGRFLREAQATAALQHDHIVTIYQVGRDGETMFLAMEYLRGSSLQDWLARDRPVPPAAVLRIGREAALGLAAAHERGLVHRDVKPANLWLEAPSGRVKVLDFGLARSERDQVLITHAGTIVGTPAYMSPEQAVGGPVTAASDLFGLGCVLYRLVAGRLPFEGETILAVLSALAAGSPRSLAAVVPDVHPALDALVMSLLAHDPARRPASARAVADALRAIDRDPGSAAIGHLVDLDAPAPSPRVARPVEPPAALDRWSRGRRIGAGLALALLLVAIPTGVIAFRSRPTPMPVVATVPPVTPPPPAAEPTTPPTPPPAEIPPVVAPEPALAANPPAVPARPDPGGQPPAIPMPTPPVPAAPPPAAVAAVGDWGATVDPDGDCKVDIDRSTDAIRIEVPPRPHLLSAGLGRINAPRLLRPVRGDFDVAVALAAPPKPRGPSTVRQFPAPYHGAGLLLWEDERNYVRLEIAAEINQGRPRAYVNFEHFDDGKLVVTLGREIKDGSTQIRLERRGAKLFAGFSPDGQRWTELVPMTVDLPERIEVGVAALNSASNRLVADFRGFTLAPRPPADPAAPRP